MSEQSRTCYACDETKPLTEFVRSSRSKSGYERLCKECNRAKARAWTAANRERALERARQWRADNPERKRETDRRWAQENRDRVNASSRAWAAANRDKRVATLASYRERHLEEERERAREYWRQVPAEVKRAKRRAWKQANPHKVRAHNHARRARPGDTADYIAVLLGDPCSYCGAPCEHIDHVDSIARGGANEWDNLTAACQSCNQAKFTKPLLGFLLERNEPTLELAA